MSPQATQNIFQMRVDNPAGQAFLTLVDQWREAQEEDIGRSEAIRRLVELGARAAKKPKKAK